MSTLARPQSFDAYEALAPGYDILTRGNAYGKWLDELERLVREHGLQGDRVLDVACGTGESFLPLILRGYQVTGCDISPGMLEHAHRKAPSVPLYRADMRDLPAYGKFDLVMCLDDGLNYILDETGLRACFASFVRNLSPKGLVIWDLNTLFQYRSQFAEDRVRQDGQIYLGWAGRVANREARPGGLVEAVVDVFERREDETWERRTSLHRQRHWPTEVVRELAESVGLSILQAVGQFRGAKLAGEPDECAHSKIVYVACHQRKGHT